MTGAERLHRRFLRGESSSQVRNRIPSLRTIGNLLVSEYAAQEAIPVSLERTLHTRDISRINSEAEDIHGAAPA